MVPRKLIGQKTYWHLLDARRMPTRYELLTSRLLYYPKSGFAVDTPVAGWYRRYQEQSALACDDWEEFADPQEMTYASYVRDRRDAEVYLAGVLDREPLEPLAARWLETAADVLAPLRFPCHGLMMAAAYLAQIAPSGRIVVAAAMQAGDELRRVQRLAYRLAQLRRHHPGLGDDARERWEREPAWQPARELIERALVAYDYGECFAALCLAIKPAWDQLIGGELAAAAARAGDDLTRRLLEAFSADAAWHAEWSAELARFAIARRPANREALEAWLDAWIPRVDAAVTALAARFTDPEAACGAALAARDELLSRCGLRGGPR